MGAARYSWLGAPGSDPPFCVAIVHQTPRARVGDIGGSQGHASPGDNMGRGQKVMEQLVQGVESALSLATHTEGWTWKEETPQGITQ